MPRDSQGNFSLPSGTLVSTGDTVLVSQHNPAMQDIAQSMGNSLDRDGKGGMRANLSMGGNKVTGLAPGVADTDAATVGQLGGSVGIPVGCVMDYAGATPPEGWLLCYGQEVSRSTYADLYALLGSTFGGGDGSTTFQLPDFRGRVSAGKDNMGGASAGRLNTMSSSTLGGVGGAQTHTLTTAQMPAHSHAVTDPGHSHVIGQMPDGTLEPVGGGGGSSQPNYAAGSTNSATTGVTIASTGSDGAHNNIQPTIILNKIIKATS